MSRELQPPVLSVSLVKIEPPPVNKNEPPESEEEITLDLKDIDIVYHPVCEKSIKSEILESYHCESVESQVLVKAENSPFIKTENISQKNKTEDTSDENVTKGTGQVVVEIQASNEHSNALSNLETDEQSILNFSKDLNSISTRNRKGKQPEKTNFGKCYTTDETISWDKDKERIKVNKAPVIPIGPHEYTSLAKDKHICNHCQHACNNLNNLKLHINKMHREVTTIYQCPYCSYKSKWSIKKHIIQKHKDTKDIQWFQCNLCEKKFKLKGHLIRHMKKVHLKHKQMKDGLDLRRVEVHEYTSLANGKHVCNHCQHVCKLLSNLRKHIEKIHREVTTMHQCPYCPFKSKWSLRLHIILKHKATKDIQWFQCNLCELKFKLKNSLTQHMKIHLKHKQMKDGLNLREKRYHCVKCDYKTYTSTNLKTHKLDHLKPEEIEYFYCYHCSYKSKRKSDLKKHIFRHYFKNVKQGKRHHCDKCEYKTYASTALKNHKLTHLKPEQIQYFCCYHCSYKSKYKGDLKQHIFRHFKKE